MQFDGADSCSHQAMQSQDVWYAIRFIEVSIKLHFKQKMLRLLLDYHIKSEPTHTVLKSETSPAKQIFRQGCAVHRHIHP